MHTDRTLTGVPLERGAEFLHGRRSFSRQLASKLRLTAVPALQTGSGYVALQGRVRGFLRHLLTTPSWWRFAGLVWSVARHRATDVALEALLAQKPALRWMVDMLCNSLGADADRLSVLELARLLRESDHGGGEFRLPGGYDRLLEAVAEGLDVRTRCPVQTIEWSDQHVSIDGRRARAAVVTLPVAVLQSGTVRFVPELPRKSNAPWRRCTWLRR